MAKEDYPSFVEPEVTWKMNEDIQKEFTVGEVEEALM